MCKTTEHLIVCPGCNHKKTINFGEKEMQKNFQCEDCGQKILLFKKDFEPKQAKEREILKAKRKSYLNINKFDDLLNSSPPKYYPRT